MLTEKLNLIKRVQQSGLPRLISDLFNPLFVLPLVIIVVTLLLDLTATTVAWVSAAAILCYTVIPIVASLYLLSINKISSLDLPERQSRNDLFLITIICAGIAYGIFQYSADLTHPLLSRISLVFFLNAAVAYLINLSWKISTHTATLSSGGAIFLYSTQLGLPPLFFGADIFSLFILLLLLPLMIWARYRLRIHTLPELFGGAVAGFLLTIIELNILTYIW